MQRYVYAIVLFIVGVTATYLLWSGVIGAREVGTAFLALIGTFVGALFAFRLNENKEIRKLEMERKAALNRALFVLLRQYNAMRSLGKEIEPFKSEFERAFNCPALQPPPYSDLKQNFSELNFLLESPEPGVLMRLSIEEEGFHQALESVRIRNDVYVREVQPVIAQAGLNRRAVPVEEIQAALGERLLGSAINTSKYMYRNVDEAVRNLPSVHKELFSLAKKLYPRDKFIRAVSDEQKNA